MTGRANLENLDRSTEEQLEANNLDQSKTTLNPSLELEPLQSNPNSQSLLDPSPWLSQHTILVASETIDDFTERIIKDSHQPAESDNSTDLRSVLNALEDKFDREINQLIEKAVSGPEGQDLEIELDRQTKVKIWCNDRQAGGLYISSICLSFVDQKSQKRCSKNTRFWSDLSKKSESFAVRLSSTQSEEYTDFYDDRQPPGCYSTVRSCYIKTESGTTAIYTEDEFAPNGDRDWRTIAKNSQRLAKFKYKDGQASRWQSAIGDLVDKNVAHVTEEEKDQLIETIRRAADQPGYANQPSEVQRLINQQEDVFRPEIEAVVSKVLAEADNFKVNKNGEFSWSYRLEDGQTRLAISVLTRRRADGSLGLGGMFFRLGDVENYYDKALYLTPNQTKYVEKFGVANDGQNTSIYDSYIIYQKDGQTPKIKLRGYPFVIGDQPIQLSQTVGMISTRIQFKQDGSHEPIEVAEGLDFYLKDYIWDVNIRF